MKKPFGCDLSKWYITRTKSPDGNWCICPPVTDAPDWHMAGDAFPTGAAALSAFAGGVR